MPKKPSKKTLKAKAWETFSEYIRRKYSDVNGNCKCVTCGKVDDWKKMQAGHAVGGRGNSVLFHESLVYPQCPSCNIFKNGNYNRYAVFMIKKFGLEKFEEFLALKHHPKKITESDLLELCEKYKAKIQELLGS